MSRLHLAGFFSSYTMEANYNRDMPGHNIPFTICHEMAHFSGYAREDEANFIGYLACIRSDNIDFRYSGTFNALGYVLSALSNNMSREAYLAYYEMMPPQMQQEFAFKRSYWQQYDGPLAIIYNKYNDIYLKANDQAEGVKSYGRMVELLLAYYQNRLEILGFCP